jgi:hypothetical protein
MQLKLKPLVMAALALFLPSQPRALTVDAAPSLPTSRLVKVSVTLTPEAAQGQSLNTLLVLGTSSVIDPVERMRSYSDLTAVASDFGTSAEEYKAALLWFSQVPQPSSLLVGRWVNASSTGGIRGATLSASQQLLATWNAVASGGFTIVKDGAAPTNVTGLNFSAAANLNAVAAIIQAAVAGTTCVWNATFQRFEITSNTAGATSSIGFLTAPGSGTDISPMLAMRSTSSGAYIYQGQVAETAVAAIQLFDNNYGQQWYAVTIPSAVDADHLAVAPFIEATTTKHIYGVSTQAAGVLSSVSTTDIAYLLSQLHFAKTVVQYSSSSPYSVCSLLGRQLTVDYAGNSTVITLMYKQEPGIVAENLNSTQVSALEAKNCNVLVAYNNGTAIIEPAKCSSGEYVDVVTGTDALAVELQRDVYNVLYTSGTKIPQTDAGMHIFATVMEATCERYVNNGFIAPGTWQSDGFGSLKYGDLLPKGFYVYVPPVASQAQADRAARKSVPFKIAVKLAGAVHTVTIDAQVNQ